MGWLAYIILLIIVGLLLLAVEGFLIPGFGVPGVLGLICLLGGSVWAFNEGGLGVGLAIVGISTAASLGLTFLVSKYAGNSFVLQKELTENVQSGNADTNRALIGKIGAALTDLRPAGYARIEGRRLDVTTEDTYVNRGVNVKIVRIVDNTIYVIEIES